MSLATDLFDEPPTCAERGCKTVLPEGAYRPMPEGEIAQVLLSHGLIAEVDRG